ncbi:S-layer homology domain-containing protein [Paenibacillus rigui]|uniref:SLH domain-containing protein n=1 Tax=Paenibacillus rigui TaxID=554312 RepID=A0A229UGX0_9BACL|nr:S-layer homology domain-containing protein [Paenibacillus rigui]OXM82646.1 hypothetical protein CF651_29955 [Paenibacillus rigui]
MKTSLLKTMCALLLALWITGAAAVADAAEGGVQHESKAAVLGQLKLLQGTDRGYELDQTFTRAQGAAMLLRLFGWETAAAGTQGLASPFTDVPAEHWAAKSIAFAYEKTLVHGITNDTFAPDASMTGAQFMALTLRALGYAEAEPQQASQLAAASGLLSAVDAERIAQAAVFRRDDMVAVAYGAIQTRLKGSERTLLQKLVEEDKAVSADDAAASRLYNKPEAAADPLNRIEAALEEALK